MRSGGLEDLLKEWCEIAFRDSASDSAVEDADGEVVKAVNEGRSVWLLPGTSGTKQSTPREIEVKAGTSLFVVAGSAHATPAEFKKVHNKDPKRDDLLEYAEKIASEWKTASISLSTGSNNLEKEGKDDLEKVKVYLPKVHIDPHNYYAKDYGATGDTPMAVVAFAKLFKNLPKGTHVIKVDADADKHADTKEKEYHLGVKYVVKVV
jgi:hypothetical protein